MRAIEEIVLEQAQILVKKGMNQFSSPEQIKNFTVACCEQVKAEAKEEAYQEALVEIRKKLGGIV